MIHWQLSKTNYFPKAGGCRTSTNLAGKPGVAEPYAACQTKVYEGFSLETLVPRFLHFWRNASLPFDFSTADVLDSSPRVVLFIMSDVYD